MENKRIITVIHKSKAVTVICILGIILGIITVILPRLGITSLLNGHSMEKYSFGADFYTEIYNAAYVINDTLQDLVYNAAVIGLLIPDCVSILGVFEILFFSLILVKNNKKIQIVVEDAPIKQIENTADYAIRKTEE